MKKKSGEARVASPPGGKSRPRSGGVPSTPAEVLLAAAELVERGWTQGAWARDAAGQVVDVGDFRAVSFCAIGAICRAAGSYNTPGVDGATAALNCYTARWHGSMADKWNDHTAQSAANVAATLRRVARELQRNAKRSAS